MKPFTVALVALVVVVGGGIYFAANRNDAVSVAPSSVPEKTATGLPAAAVLDSAKPQSAPVKPKPVDFDKLSEGSPYAQIKIKEGDPIPELFPNQAEREKISELATTYDPKEIPKIAAYLTHANAYVREAARVGLIQLGDAAAVPVLNAAAEKAPTPEEADLLREAAEFLALPRFVDIVLPPRKPS